jgi:lysophospholipase L1-like esterase
MSKSRRTRRFLKSGALLVVSLLLATVFAEGLLLVLDREMTLSSEWILSASDRIPDDDVIVIDRKFLADGTYAPYQREDAGSLVVAMGDSFTQSFPVASQDSYPAVLERILRSSRPELRVANVGLGASGTDQQLRLFQAQVLPRLRPSVVIWQFYANDAIENALKPLFSISDDGRLNRLRGRDNWLYQRQRFYRALPLPAVVKRNSRLIRLLLFQWESSLYAQVPQGRDPFEWGREKIRLEIGEIRRLAQEHGFTPFFVLVAPQSVYLPQPGDWEAEEYRRLRDILEADPAFLAIEFTQEDLAEELRGESVGYVLFADETRDPGKLGSRHLNERGYELMARKIADRWFDSGTVGSERDYNR